VEEEAKIVRHIFRRYLELGSLNPLLADLRGTGVKTKVRPLSTGRTIGGIPFTRGSLAHFLRNRFYIGEVTYKGEVFPGEQEAILDRKLFDGVQAKLDQQRTHHTVTRQASDSLLMGRIFDERGNRMTPTYATKAGVRYRYYVSAVQFQGQPNKAAKLNRVPATEIEKLIISALRQHIGVSPPNSEPTEDDVPTKDKELISNHVARVDVNRDHLAVQLTVAAARQTARQRKRSSLNCDTGDDCGQSENGSAADRLKVTVLKILWKKTPSKQPREIIPPALSSPRTDARPIRAETRATLVTAIAKGRQWLDELVAGTVKNVEQIAERETCSIRQVNRTITLAFLAPRLVQAAVDGKLPRGIGVAILRDCPIEWARQHERLGLSS
jgi:site-specific DNA recombinase